MAIDGAIRVALLALLAVSSAAGCRRKEAPEDPYAEPYGRLKDAEYTKKLEVQRDEQKDIAKRLVAIRAELEALKDEDTNSPRVVELKRQFRAAEEEMTKNRIISQALVRERILQEQEAIKAKKEASKQKGK